MTHVSGSTCRLRFERVLATHVAECPLCCGQLDRSDRAGPLLGLRLFDADLTEPQAASAAACSQVKAALPPFPRGFP